MVSSPRSTLDAAVIGKLTAPLAGIDARRAALFPGHRGGVRQPVHTCYVVAGSVDAGTPWRWGEQAAGLLARVTAGSRDPVGVAGAALGVGDGWGETVYRRVVAKLAAQPVEDLRVDFEDGYGVRPDAVEDADAVGAAAALVSWLRAAGGPLAAGARVKSFDSPGLAARSVRTLDLLVTEVVRLAGGVPAGLVVTFPKVSDAGQVEVLAAVLAELERRLGLAAGALRFEIQVETAQAVVAADGRLAVPGLIAAGGGRVSGLHFGTYDYTAGCGVAAAYQDLAHPVCDFARQVMGVAAAGTGVWVSDGSSNVLPVGELGQVRAAWGVHSSLVSRSLRHGVYQGWDLHPGQLVSRYAAVFAFLRSSAAGEGARLRAWLAGAAGGGVLDEPATARVLAAGLLRGVDCGALEESEVVAAAGLGVVRLRQLAAGCVT